MYILYTSRGIGLAYTKNVMGFNLNLGKFENLTSLNIYRKKRILNRNGYRESIPYFYLYVHL